VAKTIGEVLPDPNDEARCRLDKDFTSKDNNWAQKYIEAKSNPFDYFQKKKSFTPKQFEGGGGGGVWGGAK
jgi:hypothetical protein